MTPLQDPSDFSEGTESFVLFVNMNEAQLGDRPVQIYQTLNQYVWTCPSRVDTCSYNGRDLNGRTFFFFTKLLIGHPELSHQSSDPVRTDCGAPRICLKLLRFSYLKPSVR